MALQSPWIGRPIGLQKPVGYQVENFRFT